MILLRQKSFNRAYTESLKKLGPIERLKAQAERRAALEKVLRMRNGGKYSDFLGPRKNRVTNTLKEAKKLRLEQEAKVHNLVRSKEKLTPAHA